MDNKQLIKKFIDLVCDEVEEAFVFKFHDHYSREIREEKISYLLADKGIEKRIKKLLLKKCELNVDVIYTINHTMYSRREGKLEIRLIKEHKYENRSLGDYEEEIFRPVSLVLPLKRNTRRR